MDFVKQLRVGEECAETGFCAKADEPSAVIGGREVLRIDLAEDSSAKGDEFSAADRFWLVGGLNIRGGHVYRTSAIKASKGAMVRSLVGCSRLDRTELENMG